MSLEGFKEHLKTLWVGFISVIIMGCMFGIVYCIALLIQAFLNIIGPYGVMIFWASIFVFFASYFVGLVVRAALGPDHDFPL